MTVLLAPEQLTARLREIGAARYHDRHPFHTRLHSGQCSRGEIQAWALNRFYYQSSIPRKDAMLMARTDDSALRRAWRQRLVDHDGDSAETGGIVRWLKLCEGVGLDPDDVRAYRGVLPATRFAVDAYLRFVAEKPLVEAVASSLTEIFSPSIIKDRVAGMLAHYEFITPDVLSYFTARPEQAQRDVEFALTYVIENACTPEQQQGVIAALSFKCDVLWAMLDALHHAYVVPGLVPPGAFVTGRR